MSENERQSSVEVQRRVPDMFVSVRRHILAFPVAFNMLLSSFQLVLVQMLVLVLLLLLFLSLSLPSLLL